MVGVRQAKAVFLGRFQPFHLGHHTTVEKYEEKYSIFELVVGSSSKSRTEENPLTFEERKEIIRSCHPEVEITPLEDEDRGEEGYPVWAERLEEKTEPDVVITRNNLVQRLVREYTDAEVEAQELFRPDECSGTELRKRIRAGDENWKEITPDCNVDKIRQYKHIISETG
ncbi:MAG: nicotinamide-nucleotide adenylyltransferase [Candidatus Nanohaloarchaea archaeon]|jgi:nicotinamide-nucleotide adenylyltransferase